VTLRDATPADSEAIRAVHRTSITELGSDSYTQEQVDAWAQGCDSADYTAAIEALAYIVAERDGEIVGFGSLNLTRPEGYEAAVDAEITGVYVHPDHSREGIGTELYTELEQRARAEDIGTLGLKASRNAVPFYEHHGYERITEHDHEFSSHESTGVTGTIVEMAKEIQE
jgi:putative acetyltransferase